MQMAPLARSPWQMSATDVCAALDTSSQGLDDEQAAQRLTQLGANALTFRKTPAWLRFLRQFNDPMVIILLVTALVTGVLTMLGSAMLPDTLVILGVVLLNALLAFVQEGKAEGALQALRNMMVLECLVLRNGRQCRLPARDLVPGDLVLLEAGDRIPADLRFLRASNLHVDESSLTGESVPVRKHTDVIDGTDLVPADQRNIGFSGTFVTQGTTQGVVIATGAATVFGQIAAMVTQTVSLKTPLQRQMQAFVRVLIKAILVVGACNFAYGLYVGYPISYSFLGAVALVVAAIPEMLPTLVTSILALAGIMMARRNALVRTLPAAETLGATSVICSDKTGTLTENRMTVTRVLSADRLLEVGSDQDPLRGGFLLGGVEVPPDPGLRRLLDAAYLCNNAEVHGSQFVGDPTEIAVKVAAVKGGVSDIGAVRLADIPFDASVRYMAVLVELEGRRWILAKGAPEVVLAMCADALAVETGTVPLDVDRIQASAAMFAEDALRTLGFAVREVAADHGDLTHAELQGLSFAGLMGMIDPPKASAIAAIAACKQAGIRTVMITGDHPGTALAIARQLGIATDMAYTGEQIAALDPASLRELVEQVSVYARVAPEHKKAIAEALQANGHVVAMTGDGVNDAPALRAADIGVAMGVAGTEVAKEAADMVLKDDNFATIVAAVEEGRHAWNNLRKAILYTLPTNGAQALLILGAVLLATRVPLFAERFVLEPVQILWINLLDSVLLTLPLMMEAKERHLLSEPPRSPEARIIDALFLQRVVVIGIAIAAPGFLVYYVFGAAAVAGGVVIDPLLLTQAQTAAFWAILMGHIGYLVSARSIHASAFSFSPFSNRWLLGGIALSILIRVIPTLYPPANTLFRTAPFPMEWWLWILPCFIPSFIAIEVDKCARAWRRKRQACPAIR